ncbi:hypothetical protein HDU97_009161 [Phlyctochytrium planicorne]|nr:hypothetical protein HDU97_009161 [Phlyctochytrium planicorne]
MHFAPGNGHLDVVKFLHENRDEGCTQSAIRLAAQNGHFDVIKFLPSSFFGENGYEAYTPAIFDETAWRGQIEIVRFLHDKGVQCTKKAMNDAAGNKQMETVDFLHKFRDEGYLAARKSKGGLYQGGDDQGCCHGHLEVVEFLDKNRPEGCKKDTMDKAAANGHVAVVKYLNANRTEGCTNKALTEAASNGHFEVCLHEHGMGCTKPAMDEAAQNGHLEVVKFLDENHNEGCTTRAMHFSAFNGHLAVVKYLHFNRSEGCTTTAMDGAAQSGYLDVVKFLNEKRSEGCTDYVDPEWYETMTVMCPDLARFKVNWMVSERKIVANQKSPWPAEEEYDETLKFKEFVRKEGEFVDAEELGGLENQNDDDDETSPQMRIMQMIKAMMRDTLSNPNL